ncbi:tail fiber assembly protein [Escherichia coli]|uniref:tail fiber assembly protein n=16 Tax=cellular organisms TaxID=131567 RepID=UPI000EF7F94C|nr:tail fiber assembly protein [Escherichia coli]RLX29832.1 tail fiber assembly protein [Escherichia coli]
MNNAELNSELIATMAGEITVYNFDVMSREYISASTEYLAIGVGIPAYSCLDAPGAYKAGYAICRSADFNSWEYVPDHRGEIVFSTETGEAICRSADFNSWEYVPDHRGEIVFSTETGESKEITAPGDYPDNTTTIAPLTPYDKWDGEKWVTDTEAQHNAAVDAAEALRQSLIDAAMASISLIQLKLQAGRKLTQAETTRLNAVLDYIDAVTATDTSTAPDVIWPELPEA